MFATPGPLDFVAVATATLQLWEREARLLASRRPEPRGATLLLPRRPHHREQPDGHPSRVGPHLQGRRPALPGAVRLRAAVPERLRLPGAVGGGRGREDARIQLEAGDRVVRPGALLARLPRPGGALRPGPDRAVEEARPVDGLAQLLLHDVRHQRRVQLDVPPAVPRAWLALPGPSADAVVHALRHLDLAARDAGRLRRAHPRVGDRRAPARGSARPSRARVDDDAVDAARQRGAGGSPRARLRRVRARGHRLLRRGRPRRALPGARPAAAHRQGRRARGPALRRAVRRPARPAGRRAPRGPLGGGLRRGRHRDRPHRAGLRARGLRARPPARPPRHRTGGSGRALPRRPGRALGDAGGGRRRAGRPPAEGARPALRARRAPPSLPHLLAVRPGADLPRRGRVVPERRRDPAPGPRRQRARHVAARPHAAAHGRLARQHGRLVHLAQALLGPPPALLPVRMRAPHRRRLARRAPGAGRRSRRRSTRCRSCTGRGSTRSSSAAPAADGPSGASPRSATAGSTRASSRSRRSGTSRIARSGSAGSRPTSSSRPSASSAGGSTRCCSCPRPWRARAPTRPCWRTSASSPPTGARCTRAGATRSGSRTRWSRWAPTWFATCSRPRPSPTRSASASRRRGTSSGGS